MRVGPQVQALPRRALTADGKARRVAIRLRLCAGDSIALGPGKADLLDAIDAAGSISAAARSMGMSYRRAWLLVETMNQCFRMPMVETRPGSRSGARLSAEARAILTAYRAAELAAHDAACAAAKPILDAMNISAAGPA